MNFFIIKLICFKFLKQNKYLSLNSQIIMFINKIHSVNYENLFSDENNRFICIGIYLNFDFLYFCINLETNQTSSSIQSELLRWLSDHRNVPFYWKMFNHYFYKFSFSSLISIKYNNFNVKFFYSMIYEKISLLNLKSNLFFYFNIYIQQHVIQKYL